MQEISIVYRKLMRIGSIASLFFLAVGLIIHVGLTQNASQLWDWRNSFLYLMIGIISLLLTPVAGLLAFFVFNIKQKQVAMAFLIVTLLALLVGGTWLIHPGH